MVGAGTFIVVEGGDATGRTTQVLLLVEHLRGLGLEVVATREPGGTPLAELLRGVLLNRQAPDGLTPRAEALMVLAARASHVDSVIRPALERGAVVVCDRWMTSTYAYQGLRSDGSYDLDDLVRVGALATAGLVPDLEVLLEVDPDVRAARHAERGTTDRMEDLTDAEAVAAALRKAPVTWPRAVVDASGTPEQVAAAVDEVVDTLWKNLWRKESR